MNDLQVKEDLVKDIYSRIYYLELEYLDYFIMLDNTADDEVLYRLELLLRSRDNIVCVLLLLLCRSIVYFKFLVYNICI